MSEYGEKEYARLMKLPRSERTNEGRESDAFGGKTWTKEQQYKEEINSLVAQIYNTIESYGKLSRKEKKSLKVDIENFEYTLMAYNK